MISTTFMSIMITLMCVHNRLFSKTENDSLYMINSLEWVDFIFWHYFKNTYLGGYKFKNNDNNCWHKVSSDDWIILKLKASPTLSPSPGKLLDTCSWPNGNMWNGSAGVPCSMDFWDNPNWPMYKGFTPALTC